MSVACAALLALTPGAGCIPATGELEFHGDGSLVPGADAGAGGADGALAGADRGLILPGHEGGALADGGGSPGDGGGAPDTGAPQPDLKPPPPDTGPTTPQGPFGTSVGKTAPNFFDIPDCDGKLHALYKHFKVKKGVLVAMMSPS